MARGRRAHGKPEETWIPIHETRRRSDLRAEVFNWALAELKRQQQAGEKPSEAALRRQLNAIKREQFPGSCWFPGPCRIKPSRIAGGVSETFQEALSEIQEEGMRDAARLVNRPGSNQEMTVATRGRLPAQFEHELRPVDPAREWPSVKTTKPNKRHAIGYHQVGGVKAIRRFFSFITQDKEWCTSSLGWTGPGTSATYPLPYTTFVERLFLHGYNASREKSQRGRQNGSRIFSKGVYVEEDPADAENISPPKLWDNERVS